MGGIECVLVPTDDLLALVELAEKFFVLQDDEFSRSTADEEMGLMRRVWVVLGKEQPPWFVRNGKM